MKYLFDKLPEINRLISSAKKLLLLSDYDGTLTPIVERPDLAKMPLSMRKLLEQVSGFPRSKVGILSGRSLSDLKKMVKIKGIYYAGNHGFEIENPSGKKFIHPKACKSKPMLAAMARELRKQLKGIKGVIIENKGLTLSVHYRMIKSRDFAKFKKCFQQVVDKYEKSKKIKITQGKKVFEIRPPFTWNKGKALLWILKKLERGKNPRTFLPVYLGDDYQKSKRKTN